MSPFFYFASRNETKPLYYLVLFILHESELKMSIHELGDEGLRPTNKAWRCSKCGTELFTKSAILNHKERCTNNPNIKLQKQISKYDIEREKKLNESLRQFKEQCRVE